ncbi:MAG: hypothetical protein Q8M15_07720 [Bacteroidota bacterium]|nr:hypothetical protein [Bacteroidota bacterium]
MQYILHKYFLFLKQLLLQISLCISFCFICLTSHSQISNYTIINPQPGSIVSSGNLFVVVSFSSNHRIIENDVKVLIDRTQILILPKINQNRLSFIYENTLPDGKHFIEIRYRNRNESAKIKSLSWYFYVNVKVESDTLLTKNKYPLPGSKYESVKLKQYTLNGNLMTDNRSEFIDGAGRALRQEPAYTRTLSLNALARLNTNQLFIRFFTTTDNYSQFQNRDFFQVGYLNKWFEVSYGDINPSMDRFIVSGVRMRGVKAILRSGGSSLQFYYGEINTAIEGSIQKYIPGTGIIPTNFVNDSMYKLPGTYKRLMMAGRMELGNKREHFKFGISAFKAKDDIHSIQYGVTPKDNLAAGADMTFKLFKRRLGISFGAAVSVITHDISYGVANKAQIDTTFNTHVPYDPADYQKYLIINSSTVPVFPKHFDYGAYFGNIFLNNKFQNFSFEYRRNGPQFVSLGNPFLRNNYEGYVIGERVWFWKKRLSLNGNYQEFTNDLNQVLIATMRTQYISGSAFFMYNANWPGILFNYMVQNRNAQNAIVKTATINDKLDILLINMNYAKKFWNLNHNFRLVYSFTKREDYLRPESNTTFYNLMMGLGENFSENFFITFDAGKTIIFNQAKESLSDINTYTGSLNWQNKKGIRAGASVSNNINLATMYFNKTQRFSFIGKFGFRIYKGMALDAEYGYQPYTDDGNSNNNYKEQYVYVKYTYDFSFK